METGEISISRAAQQARFPAKFQLVTAMNPCPCGKPETPPPGCNNPIQCCDRYQSKLSGPLLDRIDIQLKVQAVALSELNSDTPTLNTESSSTLRERVTAARQRQLNRAGKTNRDLSNTELGKYCRLSEANQMLLERAAGKMGLSARAYHRVLKVARTIADLEASESIQAHHLTEALSYRIQ